MTRGKEMVVIDGANVAYEEKNAGGKPRLANLLKVKSEMEERGFDPVIIVDASLKYEIDDQSQMEALIESQHIRQVPAGTDADYFILEIANEHDARIVTNDRYRDYQSRYPWIESRRLPYMIVKGEVHLYEQEG